MHKLDKWRGQALLSPSLGHPQMPISYLILPDMEIPLIMYLVSPRPQAGSEKTDPRSFFAIPEPP
jgi:hypothetical protein